MILLENLLKALDNGNCAVGIFLDFQKAFDICDHCILLDKLHIYGICGIAHDWFVSYMSKRHQSVMYNNFESDYKEIKCGVPQCCVLPLFFIYINDFPSVSKLFMPILFAFCPGKNFGDIVDKINVEIGKIYSWVKENKLSLNVEKTNSCHSRLTFSHEIWTTYS